jgi:hypothetical protein
MPIMQSAMQMRYVREERKFAVSSRPWLPLNKKF